MAGQTRGTYRSKANKGLGVPTPPVINFAWLKSWWPETTRRLPKPSPGNTGRTTSERRALAKTKLGIPRKGRLPVGVSA